MTTSPAPMAQTPLMSREDCLAQFNVAFGTHYDVNHAWPAADLRDMQVHCQLSGDAALITLAWTLHRYAEIAEREAV